MFALLSIGLAPPQLQASCSRGAGVPRSSARARLTAMQMTPRGGGGGKEESFFDKLNPFKKKEESALTKGMDELLKDAPLPVKMFGALAKPLVESMGTMIQEGMADQDEVLQAAERALRMELGDVRIGQVFSSSSSNMNGQKVVNLQFTISDGSRGALSASGSQALELTSLQVQDATGRVIDVLGGGGGGEVEVEVEVEVEAAAEVEAEAVAAA